MSGQNRHQVILEVGAEGGSLAIFGIQSPSGEWKFCVERDESTMLDLLSDGDLADLQRGDFYGKTAYFETLDEALKCLDKYPWQSLTPLQVHPDFRNLVLDAVQPRGGQVERWKRRLSRDF